MNLNRALGIVGLILWISSAPSVAQTIELRMGDSTAYLVFPDEDKAISLPRNRAVEIAGGFVEWCNTSMSYASLMALEVSMAGGVQYRTGVYPQGNINNFLWFLRNVIGENRWKYYER